MENQNLDNLFNLSVDDESRVLLQSIGRWARIVALCTFIGYGISILSAFLGRGQIRLSPNDLAIDGSLSRASSIAGALFIAVIGTAINYFLYRFAVDVLQGLRDMDQSKLNEGFINLKIYFKIIGIILLIALILIGVVVLITVLVVTVLRK